MTHTSTTKSLPEVYMMNKYLRGSEWRKWDLHVHTPKSVLCQNFNCSFEDYAKTLLKNAIDKEISVIGMTDYFSVDGYKEMCAIMVNDAKLRQLLGDEDAEKANDITILPNIELRIDVLVDSHRVNYHVIFSEEVSIEDIEENFLNRLEFTESGVPSGPDNVKALTRRNLELLGQRLKREHPPFQKDDDIFIGMKCAAIKLDSIKKALSNKVFEDKYAIITPSDEDLSRLHWDSQDHQIRKSLIQGTDFIFSSNPNTISWCLGEKGYENKEDFRIEFKSFKPCLQGSDAHDFERLFAPTDNRYTWVKANPNFKGLLQVLNEPKDRVFIGTQPEALSRAQKRPHQYIAKVQIDKTRDAKIDDEWFAQTDVILNPGLVSIIGNKGSGKSAFADIIALSGSTDKHESFAFLNSEKFRSKRSGSKAKSFESKITWRSGESSKPINLNENPTESTIPSVKYIPQNFLETTCNENIGAERFTEELQNVIYTHIPEEERLGFSSLKSLLQFLNEEVEDSISHLKTIIEDINTEIFDLERASSTRHIDHLKSQIKARVEDLKSHVKTKPTHIEPPKSSDKSKKESSKIESELKSINEEKLKLESDIKGKKDLLTLINRKIATGDKLKQRVKNYKKYHDEFRADSKEDFNLLNIDIDNVVQLTLNDTVIEDLIQLESKNKQTLTNDLDPTKDDSIAQKLSKTIAKIKKLEEQLSEPELRYREYQEEFALWRKERDSIIGDKHATQTIKHLTAQLKESKSAPEKIAKLKIKRQQVFGEILSEKDKLKSKYSEYYKPVQSFIDGHELTKAQNINLQFKVEVTEKGFAEAFLSSINQGRVGTYQGVDEGKKRLDDILNTTDFNNSESVLNFVNHICDSLYKDMRDEPTDLDDPSLQLKKGTPMEEVFSYIFSGDYLFPNYHLAWEGKSIDQLSPGEKGNLLLVFYLLIDQGRTPLILDQPEDNLDNQTVYRTLVPCIRDAAQRRQILMVTHNPNLAVVCDSDQIIVANMYKTKNSRIEYQTGAIESPSINAAIVDILEGTRPAFDQRDAKYLTNNQN